MSSPWIEGLRSVALNVPDLAQAEAFYTAVWRLDVAHRSEGKALYLRGTGSDHHLLALYAGGPVPQLRQVTLRARSAEALQAVAEAVPRAGGSIVSPIGTQLPNPSGIPRFTDTLAIPALHSAPISPASPIMPF